MAGCGAPGGPAHTPPGWHAQRTGAAWHESIVGLWKVSWTSDGTEFNISGARTYKLDHLALAWAIADSPGAPVVPSVFLGPAVILQTITLSLSRARGSPRTDAQAASGNAGAAATRARAISPMRINACRWASSQRPPTPSRMQWR